MSQKLELNIDEVIVLVSDNGMDHILLNLKNSKPLKAAIGNLSELFDDGLQLEILTSSLHGEKLAKELGLIPDRIVKV